ncbi:MAG: helix-turn-helix transcriptional regulator [Pseudomonadota bacterium]
MQSMPLSALTKAGDMIDALGSPSFHEAVAGFARQLIDPDVFTIMRHDPAREPELLYGSVATLRDACARYSSTTHVNDPFVRALNRGDVSGGYRLEDLVKRHGSTPEASTRGIELSADEESGYRTIGWPRAMQEVGLVVPLEAGGRLQLAWYRSRHHANKNCFNSTDLARLQAAYPPIAAACRQHGPCRKQPPQPRPTHRLSPREQQVLDFILAGYQSPAIAAHLGIGLVTVKTHRKNLYNKLSVANLSELFARYSVGD